MLEHEEIHVSAVYVRRYLANSTYIYMWLHACMWMCVFSISDVLMQTDDNHALHSTKPHAYTRLVSRNVKCDAKILPHVSQNAHVAR